MLTNQVWGEMKNRIGTYKYTSLRHVDYEELANSCVLKDDREGIMLVDKSQKPGILYFATDDVEKALCEIDRFIGDVRVNFVPNDYVHSFKLHGFTVWAEYMDFFNDDLQSAAGKHNSAEEPTFLKICECDTASAASRKCGNQSRGFTGESAEWFADWIKENDVIVIKNENVVVGFCCVSIYANGTKLWIREIAVTPKFQGKGFGKRLMEQAIKYGAKRGAKKGFLAADLLNKNAIGLYNRYEFFQGDTQSELQMFRVAHSVE